MTKLPDQAFTTVTLPTSSVIAPPSHLRSAPPLFDPAAIALTFFSTTLLPTPHQFLLNSLATFQISIAIQQTLIYTTQHIRNHADLRQDS